MSLKKENANNLKKSRRYLVALAFLAAFNLIVAPFARVAAQETTVLATINFDPKIDGFGFENYGNENRLWQNDLTVEDMIRFFGAKAVCSSGATASDCVMKAAASEWMKKQLAGMNGGHCEGMATAAVRLKFGKSFKSREGSPESFQPTAKKVFDLKLDQTIGNYVAYYFTTQLFDEVAAPSKSLSAGGPVKVVEAFIQGVKSGNETYTLGFEKYDRATGKKSEGHAVTPISVEDAGDKYIMKIYDNNYPGETRSITIEKEGKQTWKYTTSTKPGEPVSEYTGDIDTKTFDLVPNSNRDKTCFEAPFADQNAEKQCSGAATSSFFNDSQSRGIFAGANEFFLIDNDRSAIPETAFDVSGDRASFSLNNDGDLLVTTADGKRIGFDPATNKFYNEVGSGRADTIKGGRGKTVPNYTIPAQSAGNPYKVTFSGKSLKSESTTDFVYSAPGFTVGFEDIRLDPNETLATTISPDGETITFTSSADGETPGIYFAFDPLDGSGASYIVRVDGAEIEAGKTLTAKFDFDNLKVDFKDNDGNQDEYDIEIVRINRDGKQQKTTKKVSSKGGDNFELDLKSWDGTDQICVKQDENGDGFGDEECNP